MAELITQFEVAEHIHSSVWQKNGVFSNEMLHSINFHRRLGHVTATEQVMVFGRGDPTLPGSDVLSWSEKTGYYTFQSTDGPEYTGDLKLGKLLITPEASDEIGRRFAQSLIVGEFLRLTALYHLD